MQDEQQPGWTFTPGQEQKLTYDAPNEEAPKSRVATGKNIDWTASEFIEHEKSASWYGAVSILGIAGIAAVYFITQDLFSVVALFLFGIAFLALGARKPKVLSYSLNDNGIQIGERFYGFDQFRSFAVIDEGSLHSISLLPIKRFMPELSIYFAPDDEDKIVDFLGHRLPFEERKQAMVDQFMRKIRF